MLPTLADPDESMRMRARLASLAPIDTPSWGVMTIGEMLRHLRGAFRIAMGEMPVAMEPQTPRTRAIKVVALWTPLPWAHNYRTPPEIHRSALTGSADFETDKAAALAAMEQFCGAGQPRVDHPMLGPMSTRDWMRWGYVHTDHHLRQFGR